MQNYIPPSADFDGSHVEQAGSTSILKNGIREISFSKGANKEGIYLNFAPGYKADSQGRGVWFRSIKVRSGFGDKFGARYVVHDENDPIRYYERNLKSKYPNLAAPVEKMVNNKIMKVPPAHGREGSRVLYNVIVTQAQQLGCHVLELPYSSGASKIKEYHETKGPTGVLPSLICIPDKNIPVFVKMDPNLSSPWSIIPQPQAPIVLPPEYADSTNIYNLDDVTISMSNEDLIAKLREFTHPEIFAACMDGYPGISKFMPAGYVTPGFTPMAANPMATQPAAMNVPPLIPPPVAIPAVTGLQGLFPSASIPSASIPGASIPSATIPKVATENSVNPLATAIPTQTKEDLVAFLKKGKS